MNRNVLTALVVILAVIAVIEGAVLLGLHRPATGTNVADGSSFQAIDDPGWVSQPPSTPPSVANQATGSTGRAFDPFAEMERMRREMDARMQAAMRRLENGTSQAHFTLAMPQTGVAPISDIVLEDNPDLIVCTLRIDGVNEDSVRVLVEGATLGITGSRSIEQTQEHQGRIIAHVHRTEQFTRSVALPSPVDPACIRTSYTDGVLTVSLPKRNHRTPQFANPPIEHGR